MSRRASSRAQLCYLLAQKGCLSPLVLRSVLPASEAASCGFKSSIGFSRQLFKRNSMGTKTPASCSLPSTGICASQPGSGLLLCFFSATTLNSLSFNEQGMGDPVKTPPSSWCAAPAPWHWRDAEMSEPDLCGKGRRKLKVVMGKG